MSVKPSILALTLERDGISQPWGFRLSGGCDVDQPLVVTKVVIGSPSDGVLQAGDIIRKIGNYDSRDLSHKDALSLFKNAGSSVSVAVERLVTIDRNEHLSRNALPFIPQPPIAGAVATPFTVAGLHECAQQPIRNNLCRFPPVLTTTANGHKYSDLSQHQSEVDQEMHMVTEQPYRTTALVLPGAKVSKDPAPTMSYLRHHPNPIMRARPSECEWIPADIAKKQQLADSMVEKAVGNDLKSGKKVVTKQFNSPIGLYSDQNIANSVQTHVGGLTPNGGVNYNPASRLRKTVHYDPSKSETFKVLQETELGNQAPVEVNIPVTRVFSPVKTPTKPGSYYYQ